MEHRERLETRGSVGVGKHSTPSALQSHEMQHPSRENEEKVPVNLNKQMKGQIYLLV